MTARRLTVAETFCPKLKKLFFAWAEPFRDESPRVFGEGGNEAAESYQLKFATEEPKC